MSEAMKTSQIGLASSLESLYLLAISTGGYLSKVRFSPFAKLSEVIGVTTDLDEYVTPGLYQFSYTQENQPCNMAGNLMLVWSHKEGYAFQLIIAMMWGNGSGFYFRSKNPQGWNPWKSILGTMGASS